MGLGEWFMQPILKFMAPNSENMYPDRDFMLPRLGFAPLGTFLLHRLRLCANRNRYAPCARQNAPNNLDMHPANRNMLSGCPICSPMSLSKSGCPIKKDEIQFASSNLSCFHAFDNTVFGHDIVNWNVMLFIRNIGNELGFHCNRRGLI